MSESVRFDRAVDYYDRTRALTPGTQARMVEVLTEELAGRGRVLEIGVGTGRIALPLRDAGVDVVGLDLSAPMLERLLAKGAAPAQPPEPRSRRGCRPDALHRGEDRWLKQT